MLTWSIDAEQDYVCLTLNGSLCLGPHLRQFSSEVLGLLAPREATGVLIDMTSVGEIDSAGLGELVILYTAAGHVGRALCLVGPGKKVTKLLEITRLSALFPQFECKEAAVKWVRSRITAKPNT